MLNTHKTKNSLNMSKIKDYWNKILQNHPKLVIYGAIGIGPCIIIMLVYLIPTLLFDQGLDYTVGIVVSQEMEEQRESSIHYHFVVKKDSYTGYVPYDPKQQEINIGDTCFVIYNRKNPKDNELIRLENNLYLIDK